jgi:hypothetical protein
MFVPPGFPFNFTDSRRGTAADCRILREEKWLHNTEVRYHIRQWNSRWYLTMVFVALNNPMQLVCRPLLSYESYTKALRYGQLLQRGIRKDARGVLKVHPHAIRICFN